MFYFTKHFIQCFRIMPCCFFVLLAICPLLFSQTKDYSYEYEIVRFFPHDNMAFTEGLVFVDGYLYESTGLKGGSSVRKNELTSGKVVKKYELPVSLFGEGLASVGDKLIQLTLESGYGYIYDVNKFTILDSFTYRHDGWGITYDGIHLITSDGSDMLRYYDPKSFTEVKTLHVHCGDSIINSINELEYVKGEIFANIWKTDLIARISPQTGEVVGWIHLEDIMSDEDISQIGIDALKIVPKQYRTIEQACLNGIAYDAINDRLFVTGKLWPKIFEIRLLPVNQNE